MRAFALLLLCSCSTCHKEEDDTHAQITTSLVDAPIAIVTQDAQAPGRVCPDPSKMTLVGSVPVSLTFIYGDILADEKNGAAYDPDTLKKMPLVKPAWPVVEQDGGVAIVPRDAGGVDLVTLPPGARVNGQGVENERWLPFDIGEKTGVIDLTTRTRLPRDFESIAGDRGLVLDPSRSAIAIDLATQKEIVRLPPCKNAYRQDGWSLSTRGRFLECSYDPNVSRLYYLDDPTLPSTSMDSLSDFLSPGEDYIVGVPITPREGHPNSRVMLERRALPGSTIAIPSDVEPATWNASMHITFCGNGELFAEHAVRAMQRPHSIRIHRGSDGALLATASVPNRNAQEYLSFDARGTHVILKLVESTTETFVYKLEP